MRTHHRIIPTLVSAATLALVLAGCSQSGGDDRDCSGEKCDELAEDFEYIVVGSGAGGGPLASRLARAGHKVLLLEAGEDMGGKTKYQVPVMHAGATEEPGLAWHYYVKHYSDPVEQRKDTKLSCRNPETEAIRVCQMQSDGQCTCPASHPEELGILYPRGGALGGSTAVNAMITVLPQASDWNGIADLTGDESWRAPNMAKYYDRVQEWLNVQRPDASIGLTDIKIIVILMATVMEFVENGWDDAPTLDLFNIVGNTTQLLNVLKRDLNQRIIEGGDGVGMWSFPLAINKTTRNGTREFILDTVEKGFPLTVRTKAFVTNVVYADQPGPDGEPRVVGVEFLDGARVYEADLLRDPNATPSKRSVTASREVILSAGAFNTPQLLKLSGIGPRAELEQHGIHTVVDRPGVGENLQDRYEVGVVAELESDFGIIEDCTFEGNEADPCFRDWLEGGGVYTSNGAITSMLMRSSSDKPDPDLHIFGVPGSFPGYYPGYSADALASRNLFTWVILKGHTENRAGTVKLRSANPTDWPEVNFRYFDEGDTGNGESAADLESVVNAVEFVRGIIEKSDDLLLFSGSKEIWPGGGAESRAEIGTWIKNEAWGHHASCSAAIGADGDDMAVLDSKFRVRGVSGLRVVDASVFPRIPGTFIVLPTYMMSEKAADTILEDVR